MVANTPGEVVRRPEVIDIEVADGRAEARLLVTPDLAGFDGHFPDIPILPGVVQLDWAVHYAKELLLLDKPVIRVERLKYTCPIIPNTPLRLSLNRDATGVMADFRFYRQLDDARELLFSQGRLVYLAEPVGV